MGRELKVMLALGWLRAPIARNIRPEVAHRVLAGEVQCAERHEAMGVRPHEQMRVGPQPAGALVFDPGGLSWNHRLFPWRSRTRNSRRAKTKTTRRGGRVVGACRVTCVGGRDIG